MGILDKKKKTVKTPSNSSTSKNVQKNGSRKASYSLSYQNETQNMNSKETREVLAEQKEIYHDNPAFESDLKNNDKLKNPFDDQSLNKEPSKNESLILETHNQTSNWTNILTNYSNLIYIDSTEMKNLDQINDFYQFSLNYQGISTLTSINNTEKFAAAAAAVSASSLVEVPDFGQELSTLMKQNRMDEIKNGSKKTESYIIQTNGSAHGSEDNYLSKNMTQSLNNNLGDLATFGDNAKFKLTSSIPSNEIKIRQKRACHLKVLVILIAFLTAGFIGCLFTYYFMRYQMENQKYLSYTQNMVLERASKLGSNKLEILVPFTTNVTDIEDQNIIVNKIEEIVLKSFKEMNKIVDYIKLHELNELSDNYFVATFNVELKDASEFSNVVLRKESETRIKIDETSDVLKDYRNNFFNVTLRLNILPEILKVNISNVEILYDFKMIYSTTKHPETTILGKAKEELQSEKNLSKYNNKKTKAHLPKISTPLDSLISKSTIYLTSKSSSSSKSDIVLNESTRFPFLSKSSEFKTFFTISPLKTNSNPIYPTKGIYRFSNTSMSLNLEVLDSIKSNFSSKFFKDKKKNLNAAQSKNSNNKLLENVQINSETIESNSNSSTDVSSSKTLIAEILFKKEKKNILSLDKINENTNKLKNVEKGKLMSYLDEKLINLPTNNSNYNNSLEIILQINGNDSILINTIKKNINK